MAHEMASGSMHEGASAPRTSAVRVLLAILLLVGFAGTALACKPTPKTTCPPVVSAPPPPAGPPVQVMTRMMRDVQELGVTTVPHQVAALLADLQRGISRLKAIEGANQRGGASAVPWWAAGSGGNSMGNALNGALTRLTSILERDQKRMNQCAGKHSFVGQGCLGTSQTNGSTSSTHHTTSTTTTQTTQTQNDNNPSEGDNCAECSEWWIAAMTEYAAEARSEHGDQDEDNEKETTQPLPPGIEQQRGPHQITIGIPGGVQVVLPLGAGLTPEPPNCKLNSSCGVNYLCGRYGLCDGTVTTLFVCPFLGKADQPVRCAKAATNAAWGGVWKKFGPNPGCMDCRGNGGWVAGPGGTVISSAPVPASAKIGVKVPPKPKFNPAALVTLAVGTTLQLDSGGELLVGGGGATRTYVSVSSHGLIRQYGQAQLLIGPGESLYLHTKSGQMMAIGRWQATGM